MQSHPLGDMDLRGPGLGSGSRRWRPASGLRWAGQVRVPSWVQATLVHFQDNEGTKASHGCESTICAYGRRSLKWREGSQKENGIREVALGRAGQIMWGQGPREYSLVETTMRDSSLWDRSQRQWCCWISVATVRKHPVHRRRLRLSYISVGYISCSRVYGLE